ncbi:hypothetical protein ACLIKD_17225 [Azonexus sp. IMCC34842]|uniref:hypothetical protein n=1 Tax=Azonexaceae TaxID=2008795 RepID=UPI001CF88751|nr:hypothetical protein [Dechloromonas denitrificans]UCV03980.1 hypothetical protein KI611_01535 [Dechloromonas denitrificans]
MRNLLVLLALLATPALAAEPALRPSARLLFKQPELLQAGACVVYQEGGSGWVVTDPVYYLKGQVIDTEVQTRHLGHCPTVPGKNIEQYSRAEFNRQALAYPCVAATQPERDEQIGMVRLRVTEWETPHGVKAANAGRLYRGMFIDRRLEKGMEIELEADLLGVCDK